MTSTLSFSRRISIVAAIQWASRGTMHLMKRQNSPTTSDLCVIRLVYITKLEAMRA